MRRIFDYIENSHGEIANNFERLHGIQSLKNSIRLNEVDTEFIKPLLRISKNEKIYTQFSCTGHKTKDGYILFRSLISKKETIKNLIRPLLNKIPEVNFNLIDCFPVKGTVRYYLSFPPDKFDKFVDVFLESLENF